MAVTLIRKTAKGKPKKIVLQPRVSLIDKYKMKVGDILLAASGDNKGVIIKSVDRNDDTVVVQDIDTQGKYALRTMGAYECHEVDFYPVEAPYDEWVVRVVFGRAAAQKMKTRSA